MRGPLDDRERIGNQQCSFAGLIGKHDGDIRACFEFNYGIIRISDSPGIAPGGNVLGDLFVARFNDRIGSNSLEKFSRLLWTEFGKQHCRLSCGCAKQRLGDPALALPAGLGQIPDGPWPLGFVRESLSIDDQDPGPSREAMPVAIRGNKLFGIVARQGRTVRLEQTEFLQSNRVQDFVVPKQVTPRTGGVGNDLIRQPYGLVGLDIVLA